MPGVVSKLNEQGEAIELNTERVRKHAAQLLQEERIRNNIARTTAKTKAKQAESVLKEKMRELPARIKAAQEAAERMDKASSAYEAFYEKYAEWEKATAEGQSGLAKRLKEDMQRMLESTNGAVRAFGFGVSGMLNGFRRYRDTTRSVSAQAAAALAETQAAIEQNQTAQQELVTLDRDAAKLEAALKEPAKKKSRKEHADDAWDNYEKEKERIKKEKEWAQVKGESYDELGEKIKVLRAQIEKLRALDGAEIADGAFTSKSKELKKLSGELSHFLELEKKRNAPKKNDEKKEAPEIKSLQERLDAMDSFYSKQTQDAEQYGRNIKEIEEKWYGERKKLIDDYISEQEKLGKKREKILQEDTGKKEGGKEKDKKSGITVSEEIVKTNHIFRSNYQEYLDGIKKTKEGIEALEKEIKEVQALIQEDIKAGDIEGAEKGEKYVEALKEKAQDLKKEVGLVTLSLKEIDSGLAEIANIERSEYELKLINIENEKKRLQEVVKEAQKAGKISQQEANKQNKQIADNAQKERQKAQVDSADPYIRPGAITALSHQGVRVLNRANSTI